MDGLNMFLSHKSSTESQRIPKSQEHAFLRSIQANELLEPKVFT